MRETADRVEELVRAIVHEARVEKLTFMAGAIAYHAFLSILPLILLVLTVVQRTQNVPIRDSVVGVVTSVLTEESSQLIQQGLTEADASVSVLGLAVLVWGALRIFRGLDTAFSDIYETSASNTFVDQLGDGLLMLVTVGLALVSVSLVGNLVSVDGGGVVGSLLRAVTTSIGLFVVFYPMYYVFPDTDVTAVEVVPGTAFTAVGLTVAQALFTAFKSGSAGSNVVASILLLLSWLYVIGLIVLLGAVISAVFSNRSEDVDVKPVVGGREEYSRTTGADVGRAVLLADLESLRAAVDDGDSVTITVGEESVTLTAPGTVVVDRETSVFGPDDSLALTLRWWPDDA